MGIAAVLGTRSLFRHKVIADLSGVKIAGYSTFNSRRGTPACFIPILIERNHQIIFYGAGIKGFIGADLYVFITDCERFIYHGSCEVAGIINDIDAGRGIYPVIIPIVVSIPCIDKYFKGII